MQCLPRRTIKSKVRTTRTSLRLHFEQNGGCDLQALLASENAADLHRAACEAADTYSGKVRGGRMPQKRFRHDFRCDTSHADSSVTFVI